MRRIIALAMLAAFAALAAGCFNPFDPRVSDTRVTSSPAPTPSSPANTVRLFAWCWQHRDPLTYKQVFTDDYRFIFAQNDSAGNAFRDRPWLREDEMDMATHLFTGGADRPPASDVSITIDNLLLALPDPRPGHLNKWHTTVTTGVDLKVTVTSSDGTPSVTPVTGRALFYLVRGDSAALPSDLAGLKPDSTRWWIERWEDETVSNGPGSAFRAPRPGARPTPGGPYELPPLTFGELKKAYWASSSY